MATYTTTSEFSDLVGSMVVTNNDVDNYTSNTQGAGTVQNIGGKDTLEFTVFFAKVNRTYTIDATPNAGGNGYAGEANDGSPAGGEEPWTATSSTEETATQKAAY
jgi:hypothetical protein